MNNIYRLTTDVATLAPVLPLLTMISLRILERALKIASDIPAATALRARRSFTRSLEEA